ncbi:MAG TPA: DsbC family protein [Noviherbaspirillum sp.]|nr:DsbC family protein [Noviherbaspirillum sp.]
MMSTQSKGILVKPILALLVGVSMTWCIGSPVYAEEPLAKENTAVSMKISANLKFSDLPFEMAVKLIRGDGSRQVAVFEDPNCRYSKHLAKDLAKLDNVTIYIFLFPILSQDSAEKSKKIWCSADSAKAWTDLMLSDIQPVSAGKCDSPIEQVLAFGHEHRITGTPMLILASGKRVHGAPSLEEVERWLGK